MKWYYAQNNQRHGPVSENEFDFLVHQKKILPDMLVWNETMANWQPLREVLPPEPAPAPGPYTWTAPVGPESIEKNGPAWEDRDSIGGINAAVKTVAELLGNRHRAFARMKLTGDWLGAFCFALFLGGVGFYASVIYNIIFSRLGWVTMKGGAILATNTGALFMLIFAFFFIPIFIAGIIILNSVIVHGCLIILGGVKQPFQATYRVVCYSFGASSFFQLIPGIGGVLSFVWNLILMTGGIARVHEISPWKASLCVVPIVLYMGVIMALGIGMM
jgi:hypothetical protein